MASLSTELSCSPALFSAFTQFTVQRVTIVGVDPTQVGRVAGRRAWTKVLLSRGDDGASVRAAM